MCDKVLCQISVWSLGIVVVVVVVGLCWQFVLLIISQYTVYNVLLVSDRHCSARLLDIVCWWQTLFSKIVGHCWWHCSAWLLDIVCWWQTLFSMIVRHCLLVTLFSMIVGHYLLVTDFVQHDCWTLFVGDRLCSARLLDIVCWWQTLFSMIVGHCLLVTDIVQHDCWTLLVTYIIQHDCWTLLVGDRHFSAWLVVIICWWQTLFSKIFGTLFVGDTHYSAWLLDIVCWWQTLFSMTVGHCWWQTLLFIYIVENKYRHFRSLFLFRTFW